MVPYGGEEDGDRSAPNPLEAVGESFWYDVIGVLFPWEVEQKKPAASGAIAGVGITFRRDFSGALLIHHIVPVCLLRERTRVHACTHARTHTHTHTHTH